MRKINKIKETDPAAAGNVEEQKAAFASMLDKEQKKGGDALMNKFLAGEITVD